MKPVRKCHSCPLNIGDHCWRYASPRSQWRNGKTCPGLDNTDLHKEFSREQRAPQILTRRQIRREMFRARNRVHSITRRTPGK
jgi:hypothetical protein